MQSERVWAREKLRGLLNLILLYFTVFTQTCEIYLLSIIMSRWIVAVSLRFRLLQLIGEKVSCQWGHSPRVLARYDHSVKSFVSSISTLSSSGYYYTWAHWLHYEQKKHTTLILCLCFLRSFPSFLFENSWTLTLLSSKAIMKCKLSEFK